MKVCSLNTTFRGRKYSIVAGNKLCEMENFLEQGRHETHPVDSQ